MKRCWYNFVIFAVVLFGTRSLHAQADPIFQWVARAGGTAMDIGQAIAHDSQGNVVVTGAFIGSADFGNQTLLSISGTADLFVAKYDASGALLWARSLPGLGKDDAGLGIATDRNDNIIVAGHFSDSAIIDGLQLASVGSDDVILFEFSPDGKVLWARTGGGVNFDAGNAVATDTAGNVFVAGEFSGPVATFGEFTLKAAEEIGREVFVAKYAPDGTVLWAQAGTGVGDDRALALAGNAAGILAITGEYRQLLVFDRVNILETTDTPDIFVALFDGDGKLLWGKGAGGAGDDAGSAVALDAKGNCYLTGFYNVDASFDDIEILSALESQDIFVASYDLSGKIRWVIDAGGSSTDAGAGIFVDAADEIFVTGAFRDDADFGKIHLGGQPGAASVFVVKIDPSRQLVWAKQAVGTAGDFLYSGYGITGDTANNLFLTGVFGSKIDFDGTILESAGDQDIFISRLSPEQLPDLVPVLEIRRASGESVPSESAIDLGESLQITYGALNIGTGSSQTVENAVFDHLQVFSVADERPLLTDNLTEIDLGPEQRHVTTVVFSPEQEGVYEIHLGVDAADRIAESDENNNEASFSFLVKPLPEQDFVDDFETGEAQNWQPQHPQRWQVDQTALGFEYCINTSHYASPDSESLLGEYSRLVAHNFLDFSFTASFHMAPNEATNPDADVCLVFGFQDSLNYAYALVSREPNKTAFVRVQQGKGTVLAQSTVALPVDTTIHTLKIVRKDFHLTLFWDGDSLLQADDSVSSLGGVGVGSWDDAPCFDNVHVSSDIGANSSPVVVRRLPDDTLTVGNAALQVDLNATPVFIDPDGDALLYSVENTNPSAVAADVSQNILTVSPRAGGTASVALSARDSRGATRTVVVNILSNRSPYVTASISDLVLTVDTTATVVDLAGESETPVFVDPDGDALFFSANSDSPEVAAVALDQTQLTILPLAPGSTQITIAASDGKGGAASTTFRVSVESSPGQGYTVAHTPPTTRESSGEIQIALQVAGSASEVNRVVLYYRRGGDPQFAELAFSGTPESYTADIPQNAVTTRGVEYFIEVVDNHGGVAFFPPVRWYSISIHSPEGITRDTPQPAGNAQNNYRLIAMPLDLDDRSPSAVFVDDLGGYNRRNWRLFDLLPDQTYAEIPAITALPPGKAFWLVVRGAGKTIDTGAGKSVQTARPFTTVLVPGWNFIGDPFTFSIPISNLSRFSQSPVQLRSFAGFWESDAVQELVPFDGYAIFNDSPEIDTLYIDPDLSTNGDQGHPVVRETRRDDAELLWAVRITADMPGAKDEDNIAAVATDAEAAWDRRDQAEPPVIGDFVSVYFSHPEWQRQTAAFATDVRPHPRVRGDGDGDGDGEIWPITVRSNLADLVHLSFSGVETIPLDYQVWLVDATLGVVQDLRTNSRYTFVSPSEPGEKHLQMVAGKPKYVAEITGRAAMIPQQFVLAQNFPNPFNPVTTIRYGLPVSTTVTLTVYDLTGAEVVRIVDGEEQPAGFHVALWDSNDRGGRPLASGVYFCQMRADSFTAIRKMVLVR